MSRIVEVKGTRFRADTVAWVIRRGLSRRERLGKMLLICSGIVYLFIMHKAKGQWLSLEALLGLLPILVGLKIRTEARLASRGDSDEIYEDRLLNPGKQFRKAAKDVKEHCLEVASKHGNYHYLLNPAEIHWVKPWFHLNLKPLSIVPIFALYAWLVARGTTFPAWTRLNDLKLFKFQSGWTETVLTISVLIAVFALLCSLLSLVQGLQIAGESGVKEHLLLYPEDRALVLDHLDKQWEVLASPGAQTQVRMEWQAASVS